MELKLQDTRQECYDYWANLCTVPHGFLRSFYDFYNGFLGAFPLSIESGIKAPNMGLVNEAPLQFKLCRSQQNR